MQKTSFLALFLLVSITSFSQLHLGLFGGITNYQGDLNDRQFVRQLARAAVGITAAYEVSNRIMVRGGFTYGKVAGNDQYISKIYLRTRRNLSFETGISEFSLAGEFYTFNMYNTRWSPYVFAGLAVYRFNPYAYASDSARTKVYLRPLGTEGQGIPGYIGRSYSRTQLALPFGGGVKFALNDNIRLGLELGLRKLFTDYLDDISTNYPGESDLMAARGPVAVAFAYRGDEAPGGDPAYPEKGSMRGNPTYKDWYYFTGLTLSFRLGGDYSFRKRGRYLDCPKSPM